MGRHNPSAGWQRFLNNISNFAANTTVDVAACLVCAQVCLDLRAFYFMRGVFFYLRISQWQMHCRSPPPSVRITHKNLNGGNMDGDHHQHRRADRVRRSQH